MKKNNKKMKSPIAVPGFKAGSVAAGVRYHNRLDLGLIIADQPCAAAGIFTTNQVKAPSVVLAKKRLQNGKARAVLVNSGNANTCVGPRGAADNKRATMSLAKAAGIDPSLVLMNSTGVIGEPLAVDRVTKAIPGLVRSVSSDGLPDFARAIMTTDTRPKLALRKVAMGKGRVVIAGVAKGAGMIMPNMATMLAYILTDAVMDAGSLKKTLAAAADDSFNALTVDGDTSTSDSIIMMAGGDSGIRPGRSRAFNDAVSDLCLELAQDIAKDAEGATRMFKIKVEGAKTKSDADKVARRVANSPLVKTAVHAADPNWGRVMAALGSAGVKLDPDKVGVSFVSEKGSKVLVVKGGALAPGYSEARAGKILSGSGFTIVINLCQGRAARTIFACDLSAEYVKINAEYRS